MRFTRIRVVRFGPLADLDTHPGGPLPGLVVVQGPNEAGKSAFHGLLTGLVHGLYPATREQNPFTPWGGGDIEIRADFLLDDGSGGQIHRRLLSTPRGELVHAGRVIALGNRSLPCAVHVSPRIYSQVYAIGLSDLAQVQDESWDAVRDHLMVGMASEDIRPPRQVAEELRESGAALWRPTRHGKPTYRVLEAELKELRMRRDAAAARDRSQREDLGRVAALDRTLADLGQRRVEAVADLERIRALEPVWRRVRRMEELERQIGIREELEGFPLNPGARLRELSERAESQRRRAEGARRLDRKIIESAARLGHDAPEGGETLSRLGTQVMALSLPRLRARVEEWIEAEGHVRGLQERLNELSSRHVPDRPHIPGWALVMGVSGLAVLVVAISRGNVLLGMLGSSLLLAAGVFLARVWERVSKVRAIRGAYEAEERRLRDGLEEAERRQTLGSRAVREILDPVGFGDAVSHGRGTHLLGEIERLADLFHDRGDFVSRDDEKAEAELAAFVAALRSAGGDESEAGVRHVEARVLALHDHMRMTAEIEGDTGKMIEIRDRIREAEGDGEARREIPVRLPETQQLIADLDGRIQRAREERSALKKAAELLAQEEAVDVVDGQMEEIREEMLAAQRERDRLFVLARILERAEARFRDAHQPQLVQRAGRHLARITEGRYARILYGEGESPHALHLDADHLPRPTPVDAPLSTGTREQVYFALRLAIVDHLDEEKESLPLLLDEVLVNWDPSRRGRVLDLLEDLSQRRQIFVFTCHPHLADEVGARGGHVIHLARPPGPAASGTAG